MITRREYAVLKRLLKMSVLFNLDAIKYLVKLCSKFEKTNDQSPHEYVKHLIQHNEGDENTAQYLEMFLELYKHDVFLTAMSTAIYSKIRGTDKMYIKIILYGIFFRFDEYCYRKYLFNLEFLIGTKLMKLLVDFLTKVDFVLVTKNVAQYIYDIAFVTEHIIAPLVKWLPYLQEALNDYRSFQKQGAMKNIKPLTVPMNMRVLSHIPRPKRESCTQLEPVEEETKVEVGTLAEVHERNLKVLSKNNKNKAKGHLLEALNLAGKYAETFKSTKYVETTEKIKLERIIAPFVPVKMPKYSQTVNPIRTTVSSLLRFSSNIIKEQETEIKWMETLCSGTFDSSVVDALEKEKRMQNEKDKLNLIEKKHLKGLLSYEDAILAKEKLLKKNKDNYERFLEERLLWQNKLEEWKKKEQERIKTIIESSRAFEQAIKEAKEEVLSSNKDIAKDVRDKSELLKKSVMKKKQEELEKRCNMIQEIKILQALAKATKEEKTFDSTEIVGLGLMCEMSLAELRERLSILKIKMKEDLDMRKKLVIDLRNKAKEREQRAQNIINEYLEDKKLTKKNKFPSGNKKPNCSLNELNDEISLLKRKLEEKRQLRMQLTKNIQLKHVDLSSCNLSNV